MMRTCRDDELNGANQNARFARFARSHAVVMYGAHGTDASDVEGRSTGARRWPRQRLRHVERPRRASNHKRQLAHMSRACVRALSMMVSFEW